MSQMQVKLIDHMGNDFSPIRAAIVSNGVTDSSKYIDDDLRFTYAAYSLINFLARGCTSGEWDLLTHNLLECEEGDVLEAQDIMNHIRHMPPHWTPFGHTAITVYVKAPIFVARQLGKHQVGFVWNEISRRYVESEPEFYVPDVWRGKAADKKQGSSGTVDDVWDLEVVTGALQEDVDGDLVIPYQDITTCPMNFMEAQIQFYSQLVEHGVAPEQARMVLPQSMMTEWYWTGNLYGFSKMFVARTDPHTQKETRDVAHMIGDLIEPLFPISWKALTT